MKFIAFYLPQFYPTKENDKWWEKGFTEWTNVSKAQPLFKGHYQPHLPADLGFYDLRLVDNYHEQTKLAKQYGIDAFCYYYYWFNGERILERPLDNTIESDNDFPFCICWANSEWVRNWHGANGKEVLMAQDYHEGWAERFIRDILPILQDDRYIKINNIPLLILHRIDTIPDITNTINVWRQICREEGLGEIHLSVTTAFSLGGNSSNPEDYGLDSALQFPPQGIDKIKKLSPFWLGAKRGFAGNIFNYEDMIKNEVKKAKPNYKLFRGLVPSWDNSARRGLTAPSCNIFHNSSPEKYQQWLEYLVQYTREHFVEEEQFIFINAWNEWAEGAHLEPDRKYGHGFLQATLNAKNI